MQVELFNYSTLTILRKSQNKWFKDMAKTYGEKFKIIGIKQNGQPDFNTDDAKYVLVSIYYMVA